jgi:hypothetical protein
MRGTEQRGLPATTWGTHALPGKTRSRLVHPVRPKDECNGDRELSGRAELGNGVSGVGSELWGSSALAEGKERDRSSRRDTRRPTIV